MAKPKKNAMIILRCFNIVAPGPAGCPAKIVITEFYNGVVRFLCPKCGRKSFARNKNGCMETIRGYSQYID